MSIHYDFYQNPPKPGPGRRKKLHARVVTKYAVSLDDLAELIQESSSHSKEDVAAVSALLVEYIFKYLRNGCRVHLDGLGYFQFTLSCAPVRSASDIRAESVAVKSIVFTPDYAARKMMRTATLVREPEKRHSKERSPEDIEKQLAGWFAAHDTLTRVEFQALSGLTRSTATRRLQALEAAGWLRKEGRLKKFPYYCPGEGHFGR